LESGSRPKSPPVQKKVSPTTQKRRDEQNAAIQRGEFQLADSPCDTCKRRLDRHIVACAKMAKDDNAACFTCKLGKMNCSFIKVMDGQVKIVRKKVKKPQEKQDVTMADVSEGRKEELAVDDEMTEVSQSKGKDLDMERGAKVDIEMAEAEVTMRKPVTIIQPDKGKGQENPAIILEPPTLVKGLTDLPDVGSSKLKGKHQKQLCFSSLTAL